MTWAGRNQIILVSKRSALGGLRTLLSLTALIRRLDIEMNSIKEVIVLPLTGEGGRGMRFQAVP